MKGTTVAESESMDIQATPKVCYAAASDFESYPEWQRSVKKVEVETRDAKGRPQHVAFTLSAVIGKVFYVLDYHYDDKHYTLSWDLVRGNPKRIGGNLVFVPAAGSTKKTPVTTATYTLDFDTGLPLPKALSAKLTRESAKAFLKDLKRRVEKK